MTPRLASLEEIIDRLRDLNQAEAPTGFPRSPADADQAGLYSWWADDEGVAMLSKPFGVTLPPLIYAGQTGATSERARIERAATLRLRIGGNHLRGNIGSSTFRLTLAAVLAEPLDLRVETPDRLHRESNDALSQWIRDHLRVVIVPYPDRAGLRAMELMVLAALDPPLNLTGMERSDIRAKLTRLRRALRTAGR